MKDLSLVLRSVYNAFIFSGKSSNAPPNQVSVSVLYNHSVALLNKSTKENESNSFATSENPNFSAIQLNKSFNRSNGIATKPRIAFVKPPHRPSNMPSPRLSAALNLSMKPVIKSMIPNIIIPNKLNLTNNFPIFLNTVNTVSNEDNIGLNTDFNTVITDSNTEIIGLNADFNFLITDSNTEIIGLNADFNFLITDSNTEIIGLNADFNFLITDSMDFFIDVNKEAKPPAKAPKRLNPPASSPAEGGVSVFGPVGGILFRASLSFSLLSRSAAR
jgi:hypothetical protein